jgi:broad specificity phosphatase PhoE
MFLCRHGATAANEMRPYILQGCEMNGPLTPIGEAQASSLARALQNFPLRAVYASPLLRARQTAQIVAERHRLAVATDEQLRECSVGRWEGMDWETIRTKDAAAHDAFFADPATNPHPGGESYTDVLNRAMPVLSSLAEKHRGEAIVVVAHNMLNRVVVTPLLGLPLKTARQVKQANCCINVIEWTNGKPELVTLNSILHLD